MCIRDRLHFGAGKTKPHQSRTRAAFVGQPAVVFVLLVTGKLFRNQRVAAVFVCFDLHLAFYTNGQSVCLTELKGYQAAVGKPVIQPRRPNSRLDKVRYMFQKIM